MRYRIWPNYNHHNQRDELKMPARWFLGVSDNSLLAFLLIHQTLVHNVAAMKKLHIQARTKNQNNDGVFSLL